MADERPPEHTGTLGRDMPCPWCDHSPVHHLRCGADIGNDVTCPCNRVPIPGIYPTAP